MTLPLDIYAYEPNLTAVIGGHVYRGCLYPNLNGMYDFVRYITQYASTVYVGMALGAV